MYASIAHALKSNKEILSESSTKFRALIQSLRNKSSNPNDIHRTVTFALKKLAKMTHHAATK
jgi:hypothetical protein